MVREIEVAITIYKALRVLKTTRVRRVNHYCGRLICKASVAQTKETKKEDGKRNFLQRLT